MKVDWPDPRCILCLTERSRTLIKRLSDEHIVPQILGGILTCAFLCKPCNDRMGQVEAALKEDPSIRWTVEKLRPQIPDLYATISKSQPFIAQSAGGFVEGRYKFNQRGAITDFRVSATEASDGSLLLPPRDGVHTITRCMSKEGASKEAIDQALARFASLEFDALAEIAPGLDVARWEVTAIRPKLDGQCLTAMAPSGRERLNGAGICLLKIAFEYLALHISPYQSALDPFREALLLNNPNLCEYEVDGGAGVTPAPFHGLVMEQSQPHPIVQIRLFGALVYRIHFPGLRITKPMPRMTYTHLLMSGYEHGDLKD